MLSALIERVRDGSVGGKTGHLPCPEGKGRVGSTHDLSMTHEGRRGKKREKMRVNSIAA